MNKYTKVCEICGKPFEALDYRRKLCSPECQAKNKRLIAQRHSSGSLNYQINFKNLTMGEVVSILMTENITIGEYIEKRDYYVLKYLATEVNNGNN